MFYHYVSNKHLYTHPNVNKLFYIWPLGVFGCKLAWALEKGPVLYSSCIENCFMSFAWCYLVDSSLVCVLTAQQLSDPYCTLRLPIYLVDFDIVKFIYSVDFDIVK